MLNALYRTKFHHHLRIYEELRNCSYDGSYDAGRRNVASCSKVTPEASALAYLRGMIGNTRAGELYLERHLYGGFGR